LFWGEDKDEESSLVIFEAKVRAGVDVCGGVMNRDIKDDIIREIMAAYLFCRFWFRRGIVEFF